MKVNSFVICTAPFPGCWRCQIAAPPTVFATRLWPSSGPNACHSIASPLRATTLNVVRRAPLGSVPGNAGRRDPGRWRWCWRRGGQGRVSCYQSLQPSISESDEPPNKSNDNRETDYRQSNYNLFVRKFANPVIRNIAVGCCLPEKFRSRVNSLPQRENCLRKRETGQWPSCKTHQNSLS